MMGATMKDWDKESDSDSTTDENPSATTVKDEL